MVNTRKKSTPVRPTTESPAKQTLNRLRKAGVNIRTKPDEPKFVAEITTEETKEVLYARERDWQSYLLTVADISEEVKALLLGELPPASSANLSNAYIRTPSMVELCGEILTLLSDGETTPDSRIRNPTPRTPFPLPDLRDVDLLLIAGALVGEHQGISHTMAYSFFKTWMLRIGRVLLSDSLASRHQMVMGAKAYMATVVREMRASDRCRMIEPENTTAQYLRASDYHQLLEVQPVVESVQYLSKTTPFVSYTGLRAVGLLACISTTFSRAFEEADTKLRYQPASQELDNETHHLLRLGRAYADSMPAINALLYSLSYNPETHSPMDLAYRVFTSYGVVVTQLIGAGIEYPDTDLSPSELLTYDPTESRPWIKALQLCHDGRKPTPSMFPSLMTKSGKIEEAAPEQGAVNVEF